eukprot:6285227-Lingulodinium_polyedra.AAC.1
MEYPFVCSSAKFSQQGCSELRVLARAHPCSVAHLAISVLHVCGRRAKRGNREFRDVAATECVVGRVSEQ